MRVPAGWASWVLHGKLQSKLLNLRHTMTSQRHLLVSRLAPMCRAREQRMCALKEAMNEMMIRCLWIVALVPAAA